MFFLAGRFLFRLSLLSLVLETTSVRCDEMDLTYVEQVYHAKIIVAGKLTGMKVSRTGLATAIMRIARVLKGNLKEKMLPVRFPTKEYKPIESVAPEFLEGNEEGIWILLESRRKSNDGKLHRFLLNQ